jgi:hypothetical protein
MSLLLDSYKFWVWSENFYCQFCFPVISFAPMVIALDMFIWLGKWPICILSLFSKLLSCTVATCLSSVYDISFYWGSFPTRIDPHVSLCFSSSAGTNYCLCGVLWAVHIGTVSRWYCRGIPTLWVGLSCLHGIHTEFHIDFYCQWC